MEHERLSIRVPAEQMERLRDALPWGILSPLIRGILEVFERDFAKHGFELVGAIIAGNARFEITGKGIDVSTIETTAEEE